MCVLLNYKDNDLSYLPTAKKNYLPVLVNVTRKLPSVFSILENFAELKRDDTLYQI